MKFLERAAQFLCVFFLSIATGLVAFNVGARYIFNYGVPWCEEAIRYSVIFATFFGLSLAVSKNQSMKIDVLLQLLKGRAKKVIDVFGTMLESLTLFGFLYFSYLLVIETIETGQITPSTDYPMYIPYLVVFLGVAFCAIRSIQSVKDVLRKGG